MKTVLVVDNPDRWSLDVPAAEVVAARDYLLDPKYASAKHLRVCNMCRSYRYQALGYYVSLVALARGHRPLPSVATLQDLKLTPIIRLAGDALDRPIQRALRPLRSDEFELSIYFGRNMARRYDPLARALFDQFPAPMLRATFSREGGSWRMDSIRAIGAAEVPERHRPFVAQEAARHFARGTRRSAARRPARFDLAILHDPADPMPPSDKRALKKFVAAAEALGIRADLVERDAYERIAEYDALFIRDTTQVNHHTYRFARRAAAEGLVVIDDPESIVRCTNKVFLAELLSRHRLPAPRTMVFSRELVGLLPERIGFPCVLKQPDGSFSTGVVKVRDAAELAARLPALFDGSDLLLAQEFVPTEYDWRIGVLGGEAIYACRYFMARHHWQIMKHGSGGRVQSGRWETLAVADAPKAVIDLAVKATKLIGNGLYGVDLKMLGTGRKERPVVIEINDNPSIDAGVEDIVLGDRLYEIVMRHFLVRLEERAQ